ncbi:hypothetical protein [Burkholderia cenocepacia]|uniref:hypothetical protein n=1 Tax=Burkholderia cenocepacia TaxID=95486 RepID=UPI001B978B7F|nr:hypothetical protein [Burkholderia cenocepacia]MBR8428917.1 hypothetical protein [Burkholderia cenocepacia]
MKIGVKFVARFAIAIFALSSIRYSGLHEHVDVSVPSSCVAGVAKETHPGAYSCVYRDVSVRGHMLQRNFEVYGPSGVGFFAKDARVVSPGDNSGFTWRSLALLLIAIAMWVPSLLPLFNKRVRP